MTKIFRPLLVLLLVFSILVLSSCTNAKIDYYSLKANYVDAVGTVESISYNEDYASIYFNFTDIAPSFDNTCFKIVGQNVKIVLEKDIYAKIQIGDQVQFVTAPRHFGDGYIMPIVSISVEGEELLTFEDGYRNLLKWLN